MLQFTPAKAAASILLLIFQTIQVRSDVHVGQLQQAPLLIQLLPQHIQTNKQDCHRLARRCLSLLVDMRDQLADHVESAPPSLMKAMKKFEE